MVVQMVELVQWVVCVIVIMTEQYAVCIVANKHSFIPIREVQIRICKVC
jgi:hypothetical protein